MILLEGINKSSLVLLFGTGTVGCEIYEALLRYDDWRLSNIRYPWDANARVIRCDFWKKLLRCVGLEYLSQGRAVDVQFIWSAGKAGMLSPFVEIEKERKLFEEFLDGVNSMPTSAEVRKHLHFVSSAGGLFEGQRNATGKTPSKVLSSYGMLKKYQETMCSKSTVDSTSIYRPSSVVGRIRTKKRRGLVTTLLHNQYLNLPTCIYGRLATLRDYVDVRDVGRFIARNVSFRKSAGTENYLLASGKPTSVRDIIFLVEKATFRPLNLRVSSGGIANDRDITFARKSIAANFKCRDLETSIANSARQV